VVDRESKREVATDPGNAARTGSKRRFRVIVRVIPDGGHALTRARGFIIDRFLGEILAELEGEGDGRCGR